MILINTSSMLMFVDVNVNDCTIHVDRGVETH